MTGESSGVVGTEGPLAMVGVSHASAPLAVLERLSVRHGAADPLFAALRAAGCSEAVVLSTCSRTEVYANVPRDPRLLLAVLAEHGGLRLAELEAAAVLGTGRSVVEHLFRVAAGLESRVLGEVEIQGQTRTAFRQAQAAGLTGPLLSRLFPAALHCGARVRDETALGGQGRSLARRAVDLGLAALRVDVAPVVLVVGSGRMAATAVEHLAARGHAAHVAARDEAGASRLTTPNLVCPLPGLTSGVAEADLLLCATSAAAHVVTLAHVREAMASRSRPLIVVDLSVPRNVDPRVGRLAGVRLIDVESMNDDAARDPELQAAVRKGMAVVEGAVQRYVDAEASRQAGPMIAALRLQVERTCLNELTRLAGRGTGGTADLTRLAHAVAGKVLHRPTVAARTAAAAGDVALLRLLCELYDVQVPEVGVCDGDAELPWTAEPAQPAG
ncbi:MAG: hemA [Frankiales bacterium]|nr:hemA [Frankiales bacterium]